MGNDDGAIKCNQLGKPHIKKSIPGEDPKTKAVDSARGSYGRLETNIFTDKTIPEVETKVTYKPTDSPAYDYRNQWNAQEGFVAPVMDGNNKIVQQTSIKDDKLPSVFTVTAFTVRGASEGSTLSLSKASQDWGDQFEVINANKKGDSASVVTEAEYNSFINDYEREAGTTASDKRDLNETVVHHPATAENKKAVFNAMAGKDNVLTKGEYSEFMQGLMQKGEVSPGANGDVSKVTTDQFVDYVNSKTTAGQLDKTKSVTEVTTTTQKDGKKVPEFPVPTAEGFKSKYNLDINPENVARYQEASGNGKKGFEIQMKDGTFIRNLSDNGTVTTSGGPKPPAISYDAEGKLVVDNSRGLEIVAGEKLPGVTFNNSSLCKYQASSKGANDNVTLNNSDALTIILDGGNDVVKTTGKNNKFNTFVKSNSNLSIEDSSTKLVKGEKVEQGNRLIVDADFNEVHDAALVEKSQLSENGKAVSKEIRDKNEIDKFWHANQLNFEKKK